MNRTDPLPTLLHLLPRRALLPGAALAGLAAAAPAQSIAFSIDWGGITVGAPSTCSGVPITEGDVLVPANATVTPAFGPLPLPCIVMTGGFGGLGLPTHGGCVGHPGGTQCPVEVDALSFGLDWPVRPTQEPAGTYVFSVDECARGVPGTPRPPAVWTEAPVGDASADVWNDGGLPVGPLPPIAPGGAPGHYRYVDGNGLPSGSGFVYPGTGLIEPNFPVAVDGDNLDAVDFDTLAGPAPVFPAYFSLDGLLFDACKGVPGAGTAFANGFLPGDVLVTTALGALPAVYAPAAVLGLDVFGAGRDDLDALALWENGVPGFQPSFGAYTWAGPSPAPDMLLFSVRRGSTVIGFPDSLFGVPIQEGDILMPPIPGGLSPFPAIFIAQEWIGLASVRAGAPMSDELDALDTHFCPEPGVGYCFGDGSGTPCPCGNFGLPGHGCEHSFLFGGGLLAGAGKPIVSADTFTLTASNLPPVTTVLFFQAAAQTPFGAPFGDGLLCTAGPVIRLGALITAGGTATLGPGISISGALPATGGTRYYQGWYRNAAAGFCPPAGFNLTNGYATVWVP